MHLGILEEIRPFAGGRSPSSGFDAAATLTLFFVRPLMGSNALLTGPTSLTEEGVDSFPHLDVCESRMDVV